MNNRWVAGSPSLSTGRSPRLPSPRSALSLAQTRPADHVDPTTISVLHWGRLLEGELFATSRYVDGAVLMKRTFGLDGLACPTCKGRMKLVALITEPRNIVRFLSALGEPTDVPARSPNRGPPYWKSTVLRRKAFGDAA